MCTSAPAAVSCAGVIAAKLPLRRLRRSIVDEFWPVVLLLALFVAYVLAKVVYYVRKSKQQWKHVDRSKLKEWKDDDEW
jgi:hypothetical protein